MGWDVVQIGLKHNLPVEDPIATAKEVAKRLKRNIRLVYRDEYKYDAANNIVSSSNDDFVEIGTYKVNDSNDSLQMIASTYQVKNILNLAGIEKLRTATYSDGFAELLLDAIDNPFELYEIENVEDKDDHIFIRIFKENVDLDISVVERWAMWECAFHPENVCLREWLTNYRMKIFERAKLFGCNEVIICSDQDPTITIYDSMNLPSDQLKEYATSYKYYEDTGWLDKGKDVANRKKNAKQIMFSSLFANQLEFDNEDFVEVIYDDFKDLERVVE